MKAKNETTSETLNQKSNKEEKWGSYFVLPASLALGLAPCCILALIHCGTSDLLFPVYTHIIAGAIQIVSAGHGDVNGLHLGPAICCAGFREVACRRSGNKRVKNCHLLDFSFISTSSKNTLWKPLYGFLQNSQQVDWLLPANRSHCCICASQPAERFDFYK